MSLARANTLLALKACGGGLEQLERLEQLKHLEQLESACSSIVEENMLLKAKLYDLEGHSRRQNIIRLPESMEGLHPAVFFSQLLAEVFVEDVLVSIPRTEASINWVLEIICFHRFHLSHAIWSFYEDDSAIVLRQCRKYNGIMADLRYFYWQALREDD